MDRAGLEGEGLDAGDTDGATLEENNQTGGAALQDDPEGPWCWWSSSRGLLGPLVMEDLYRGGRLIEGVTLIIIIIIYISVIFFINDSTLQAFTIVCPVSETLIKSVAASSHVCPFREISVGLKITQTTLIKFPSKAFLSFYSQSKNTTANSKNTKTLTRKHIRVLLNGEGETYTC